jgi:hypothetical protein
VNSKVNAIVTLVGEHVLNAAIVRGEMKVEAVSGLM